eukprot:8436600-Prorocentrum_lima.AAC.1
MNVDLEPDSDLDVMSSADSDVTGLVRRPPDRPRGSAERPIVEDDRVRFKFGQYRGRPSTRSQRKNL